MPTNTSSALIVPAADTNAPLPDLRPAKGLLDIPLLPWWGWALIALTLAAAVIGLLLWRRRNRPQPPPPVPPTPAETARARLRTAFALVNTPQPFCTELADAIRAYLDARFQLHATDQTTEELIASLHRQMMISTTQRKWLTGFLGECDLAKFAKARPPMTELLRLQNTALAFVDECEPPPLPDAATQPPPQPESAPTASKA
jgi:hypothetical protein